MGVLRYLKRSSRIWRETGRSKRWTPSSPDPAEIFLPTVPGISPASAARRVSTLLYRVADRAERAAFVRGLPFPQTDDLAVYRRSGRLWVAQIVPGISPADAYAASQRLVVELCERLEIPYFLVPESNARRARIGIADSEWSRFLTGLDELARSRPVYVGVEGRTVDGRRRRYADLATTTRIQRALWTQPHLEVFCPALTDSSSRVVFDRPFSCHVERWTTTDSGGLQAPTRNERTTHVGASFREPSTAWSHGQQLPTLTPFTARGIFDIDFPIDVVYMWVDGADPEWLERKNAALLRAGLEPLSGAAPERFRDNGELRYSMRSVELFAPWVRRIYLVTDKQVPAWLDTTHPKVTLVDHVDLFDGKGTLPNFNSHAIGARLHHISGLSEHYIHFNDDFFLGRPVLPQLFFTSSGMSKFFLSRSTLGFHDAGEAEPHEQARRNVVALLNSDFGRAPTRAFFHTPIVQRRSTMLELERRYPEVFDVTWSSQFRSGSDYEINSWLHHYFGYLVGAAIEGSIRYDYFNVGDPGARRRMRRLLRRRDMDAFCINDSSDATEEHQRDVAQWMQAYYPEPASWELEPVPPDVAGADAPA